MIQSTQFTKAALIMNEAQKEIAKLIGVPVRLSFEIETPRSLVAGNVIKVVCGAANISMTVLNGRSRTNEVAYARYVCFYLLRKYLGMTLKSIGKLFNRDHSTVMWGLDVLEKETTNEALQDLLAQSEAMLIKMLRDENTI